MSFVLGVSLWVLKHGWAKSRKDWKLLMNIFFTKINFNSLVFMVCSANLYGLP